MLFIYLCIYSTVVLPLGVFTCRKLRFNIEKELHQEKGKVFQRIIKTYSLIQCIAWPCIFTLGLFIMVNDIIKVLGPLWINYGVIVIRFLFTLICCYLNLNSLIVALCRYIFIVYSRTAESFGINKLGNMFVWASRGVPILLAIMNEATVPIENVWISIFMPDYKKSLQINEVSRPILNVTSTHDIRESPFFIASEQYFNPSINLGIRITCSVIVGVTFSNIMEGFLYLHIYIFKERYDH